MADKCGDLGEQALDSGHMSALMPLLVYTCKLPQTGENLPKNYLFVIERERKNGELRGDIRRENSYNCGFYNYRHLKGKCWQEPESSEKKDSDFPSPAGMRENREKNLQCGSQSNSSSPCRADTR
jgi:hypothetical protein